MESSKKFGKSSFAKHLRNKKSKWTKAMANSKSRLKAKKDIQVDSEKELQLVRNKFDDSEWT